MGLRWGQEPGLRWAWDRPGEGWGGGLVWA